MLFEYMLDKINVNFLQENKYLVVDTFFELNIGVRLLLLDFK